MDEMGMVMLFAGVQKDDPTNLQAWKKILAMHAPVARWKEEISNDEISRWIW